MLATDFDTASTHLKDLLGIDLARHLVFSRADTLRDFSVLGTLVVVYRYAEALGRRLVVHDMTTGGHESHLLGTELDFDLNAPRRQPLSQLNVVADLLRMRKALAGELEAFRIGYYFDKLSNTEADTLEEFKARYGDTATSASMHLGVRYRWSCREYRGLPIPADGSAFVLWGKGKKGFGNSGLWTRRIASWDVGFLKARAEGLARTVIALDFRALDYNPPPLPAVEHLIVAP